MDGHHRGGLLAAAPEGGQQAEMTAPLRPHVHTNACTAASSRSYQCEVHADAFRPHVVVECPVIVTVELRARHTKRHTSADRKGHDPTTRGAVPTQRRCMHAAAVAARALQKPCVPRRRLLQVLTTATAGACRATPQVLQHGGRAAAATCCCRGRRRPPAAPVATCSPSHPASTCAAASGP